MLLEEGLEGGGRAADDGDVELERAPVEGVGELVVLLCLVGEGSDVVESDAGRWEKPLVSVCVGWQGAADAYGLTCHGEDTEGEDAGNGPFESLWVVLALEIPCPLILMRSPLIWRSRV